MHAVDGNGLKSGVDVASTIKPISPGSTPAADMARLAASAAMVEVDSPSPATWRERMPVCEYIHSSEVSRALAMSSFVTTRSGR